MEEKHNKHDDSEMIEEIKKRIESLIKQKQTENEAFKKLLRALTKESSKTK